MFSVDTVELLRSMWLLTKRLVDHVGLVSSTSSVKMMRRKLKKKQTAWNWTADEFVWTSLLLHVPILQRLECMLEGHTMMIIENHPRIADVNHRIAALHLPITAETTDVDLHLLTTAETAIVTALLHTATVAIK